ncbi:MAG: trypsin-like serine protease [Acholeplasmataceae bacterium]|mgnify:CR=1 FL=1|nr:trypsin-like serine protease [Acholeplasmataceae bacterium]
MKKHLFLFMILVITMSLVGCDFFFPSGGTTGEPTSFLTSPRTTTESEINMERVISDVYQRIYEDLYDEVRAEVIADLSDEEFQRIYQDILADLYQEVDAGNISVTAVTVADLIMGVARDEVNSVIGVSNYNASNTIQSVGSGVIYKHIGSTYYVMTNEHVIEDGTRYEIRFASGTSVSAVLLGSDTTSDLAVLSFQSDLDLKVASIGDSDSLPRGMMVLAVGHPNGYDYFNSVTMGIVSGKDRYFDIDDDGVKDMFVGYIQHDAPINSGNSGGALFNLAGEVVGINVIKIASTAIEGMGFAIPATLALAVCEDIEELGFSNQIPGVGIQFNDIASDRETLDNLGIEIPSGINNGFYVHLITPNSSVDGKVLPGDIVLEIGDIIITNLYNFSVEFSKYHVGDIIDIVVYRNGETITLEDIELLPKVQVVNE